MATELIVQNNVLKGKVNSIYKTLYYFDNESDDRDGRFALADANPNVQSFLVEPVSPTLAIQLILSQVGGIDISLFCFMTCADPQRDENTPYLQLAYRTKNEPVRFYFGLGDNIDLAESGLTLASVDNLAEIGSVVEVRVCPKCKG
jgi:hypothetical protein